MYLEVNQPGFIPGKIRVDNEQDAEKVFAVLVDASNIPGTGQFKRATLYGSGKSDIIWSREFDDYL